MPSRARSYQPPPPAGDDARTQLLPASMRAAVVANAAQQQAQPRPSRPLLDFTASDDDGDEDATRLFESGRNSAARPSHAPPPAEHHTLPAAGVAGKKTLQRNPAAVEDDIQARALLAGETGENPGARARKPVQTAQNAARRESTPPPAMADASPPVPAGVVMPSRRPPRSATSTASAFQRTEAEPAPPFARNLESARALSKPGVQPVPSTAASLPAATWSASGEQVAAIVSTMPGRRTASWFMALGAAVVLVVVGSAVFLRNPSTAMAASALADPVAMATAGQPSADLPDPTKASASADLPASVTPPTPPPIPVDQPAYVPGSSAPEPVEPVAVAPAPEPPADEKPVSHRHVAATPAPPPKPKTEAAKPAAKPVEQKKVAAAPQEPKKKSGKGEQSDDERKASEEAKRLAQKQLEDQL